MSNKFDKYSTHAYTFEQDGIHYHPVKQSYSIDWSPIILTLLVIFIILALALINSI